MKIGFIQTKKKMACIQLSWLLELDKIHEKYPNRDITEKDPAPIQITPKDEGPIEIAQGMILCDICTAIIKANYLKQHRESGACERKAEAMKQRETLS